jgi:hypothetical protein
MKSDRYLTILRTKKELMSAIAIVLTPNESFAINLSPIFFAKNR